LNKLKEFAEQFRCEFLPQFRQVIGFSLIACLMGWLLLLPEKVWGAGQGGAPGGFLQFGAGARALAMGRAFVGVADDASAVTWNPAGLVQIDRKEVQAMTATLFAETKFQYLSFVWPRKKGSVWGFNLSQLQSTGFEKVEVTIDIDPTSAPDSPDFLKVEKVGDFVVGQQAITMAYGRPITEKVSVGLNFKQTTNQVDDFTQKFMTFDVGILATMERSFSTIEPNFRSDGSEEAASSSLFNAFI